MCVFSIKLFVYTQVVCYLCNINNDFNSKDAKFD